MSAARGILGALWLMCACVAFGFVASQIATHRAAGDCLGELLPNHSGVIECHTGPYTGPMPIDTTNGADIDLSTPWRATK